MPQRLTASHSLVFDADNPRFSTHTGVTEAGKLLFRGAAPGIALFGGYLDLDPGRYRAIVWLDDVVGRDEVMVIEVCNDLGSNIVATARFEMDRLSTVAPFIDVSFELKVSTQKLEIRVHTETPVSLAIVKVELVCMQGGGLTGELPEQHRATRRRPLNILYHSCHEVLEYDELRMLTEQGHRVFSLGAYCNPDASPNLRQALPAFYHPGDFDRFAKEGLSPSFVAMFDVAIVMHQPDKIPDLVAAYPALPIVYRSIGQSNLETEASLAPYADKISIVRYSERERSIPGFLPAADVIYFGKYAADFDREWLGGEDVLTFHNNFAKREKYNCPNLAIYQLLAQRWPCNLYGMENGDVAGARGEASPAEQLALYRNAAAYLYVYTVPPSYTLSLIEAMASGVPVVAPSADFIIENVGAETLAQTGFSRERYEVSSLLDDDPRLVYASISEAHANIQKLLEDKAAGAEISRKLKAKFRQQFDAEKIGEQWSDVLYRVVDKAASRAG